MSLNINPVWSWPFLLLCCLLLAAVLAAGYPRRIRHLGSGRQRLLIVLRAAVLLALLFLMLRPSVELVSQDRSDSVIYVVTDTSQSMQTPDGAGGKTRFEEQTDLLAAADSLLARIGETVEIRHRSYDDSLRITESGPEQMDGSTTSLANALEGLHAESTSDNVTMILMLGDGRQAALGNDARSPVPLATRFGRRHTPIYSTVFGTSDVGSSSVDTAVTELDIPRDVFVGNVVPVSARIRAQGAAGKKTRVRVLVEGPRREHGQSGEMVPARTDSQSRPQRELTFDIDSFDRLIDLSFVPPRDGEWKVAVEVEPVDGEARPTNNRIETIIKVQKGGIRVAYFDRSRPEVKWIRSVTISNRVQLDFQQVYFGRLKDRNQFDDDWFFPGRMDAFIIGDLPADAFGKARLDALYRCCREGAGLIMIGGTTNFGVGGWQNHRVASLFPVDVGATTEQLTGPARMLPTERGLRHSVMSIAPVDTVRRRWEELPALSGATRLRLPSDASLAQVLAETPEQTPLLVSQQSGAARVMAFAGDTTWKWALQSDKGLEANQRFWRQVILWITNKEEDTAGAWVTADPRDTVPGQTVDLAFGLRDAEGRAIANAGYTVIVSKPDGTQIKMTPSRDGAEGTARFSETDQPGDYWVRLVTKHDEELDQSLARFLVNARDPELDNPSADPEMMKNLAHHSGGDFLTGEELIVRLQNWAKDGLPGLQIDRAKRINLWDNWYVLLAFTGLLTCEWSLRKRSGLV